MNINKIVSAVAGTLMLGGAVAFGAATFVPLIDLSPPQSDSTATSSAKPVNVFEMKDEASGPAKAVKVPAAPVPAPVVAVEPEYVEPEYVEPEYVEETTYNPETGVVTGPGCPPPFVIEDYGNGPVCNDLR